MNIASEWNEEWRAVDPKVAEEFLATNIDNRPLRPQRAIQFAEVMEANQWVDYHPHGISFDSNGRLIDGQHRLHAILLSGKTIMMRVTYGLRPEVHSSIDIGAARTAAEILRREGMKDTVHMSALISTIFWYDNYPNETWNSILTPAKSFIYSFAQEHTRILNEAITEAQAVYRHARVPRTPYATLYFLASRHDLLHAWDSWHEGVVTGVGLARKDPRLTLRNYFSHSARKTERRLRWDRQRHVAIMLKAYTRHLEGGTVGVLRFEPSHLPMPVLPNARVSF